MLDNDYAGEFDPDWTLSRLSRAALARLCREIMLVSMYHDRALMPHVVVAGGQDATIPHADSEWMGASPVYTQRNKKNLNIEGDGVGEALKSFQFDIGAPHHFLDFQFELVDHDLGFFWLPFCGAHDYLREIMKNDPKMVTNMCHHMEDRTFDATLGVTNPKLRANPIHRPPKADEFTGDHCRWEVRIADGDVSARPGEPSLDAVSASGAATFDFVLGEPGEPGGLADYSGDFVPKLRLEDLAHHVLVRQAKEFALDCHLLMRAGYFAVDELLGTEVLDDVGPQHRAAIAPAVVQRFREALGIEGDDMAAIAKMLQLDPFLVDDYVNYRVEVMDDRHGRITFGDSVGLDDDESCRSPLSWLRDTDQPGFEHVAQAVNPQARVSPAGDMAWDIEIDLDAEPVEAHWATSLVSGGKIAGFDLTERAVAAPTRRH